MNIACCCAICKAYELLINNIHFYNVIILGYWVSVGVLFGLSINSLEFTPQYIYVDSQAK